MTQLGELQKALPRFEGAGVKLYAVSYDSPAALAAFAKAQGIGFPLLADVGSSVIRRYGILNTLISEEDVPFFGIPFPGTYLVDEGGVVREKFFRRHIANRDSASSILESFLGEILVDESDPRAMGGDDDVKVSAFFHGGALKSGPRRSIVVRFELREGLHIYGEPVPDGMVATQVTVEGPEGLIVEAPVVPPAEPFRLEALGADLRVWSGTVDFQIPVWANSKLVCLMRPVEPTTIPVEIRVRYQACDDRACLIPRTERLSLDVPLAQHDVPRVLGKSGHRVVDMDFGTHFGDMMKRATEEPD